MATGGEPASVMFATLPTSDEIKKARSLTFTSLMRHHAAVLRHRDKFIFNNNLIQHHITSVSDSVPLNNLQS
jgi:hypothetical protein